MAGKYINIITPGYTALATKDLGYTPGTGDAADLNPFDPTSVRPLVEGEWLERAAGRKVTRGGNNAMAVSGTLDNQGTAPAFLYFGEEGRYDAQARKLAHVVQDTRYEFRTKLCDSTGLAVGDPVSVWDWDGPAGAYGIVRRVLGAATSGGFVIGHVTRVYGTNDIAVLAVSGSLLA